MSQIQHDIHHGLQLDQAKQAAHLALDEYVKRYADRGLTARWASDTRAEVELATRGVRVHAIVDVLPEVLHVVADVPLLLRAFKGAAVSAVEREAQKWIAQVKSQPPA